MTNTSWFAIRVLMCGLAIAIAGWLILQEQHKLRDHDAPPYIRVAKNDCPHVLQKEVSAILNDPMQTILFTNGGRTRISPLNINFELGPAKRLCQSINHLLKQEDSRPLQARERI